MMWFTLAALIGCSVKEAQSRIDSAEFSEWMASYTIAPFGPRAEEWRVGVLCSIIGRIFGGKLDPEDFFPSLKTLDQRAAEADRNPALEAFAKAQLAQIAANVAEQKRQAGRQEG